MSKKKLILPLAALTAISGSLLMTPTAGAEEINGTDIHQVPSYGDYPDPGNYVPLIDYSDIVNKIIPNLGIDVDQ